LNRQPRPFPTGSIHCVGVGGAGMSALAWLWASGGRSVTGSDPGCSPGVRQRLESVGVVVRTTHDERWVAGVDVVVATDAVGEDHPELAAARRWGIPIFRRPEALASVCAGQRLIAVAGAHGKTTTTGMIAKILIEAGLDPTVVVGGEYGFLPGVNARLGGSSWWVVEACEAYGGLEWLTPHVAVLTSLDPDHLDFHGSVEALNRVYLEFADRVEPGGALVWCADDETARGAIGRLEPRGRRFVSYGVGVESAVVQGKVAGVVDGGVEFGVCDPCMESVATVNLGVPGRHNVSNALASWIVGRVASVPPDSIAGSLSGFCPAVRRFDRLGERDGVSVVDDYAHHPQEIRATLSAARSVFPGRRLVVVFQPHLPSRTRDFLEEFAAALADADRVFVTDVYLARQAPDPEATGARLAGRVRGPLATSADSFDTLLELLRTELVPGDVLMVVGAGDIRSVGERFLFEGGTVTP
jgi:UDP-N-acetylmuramate--alanine ligase